MPELFKEPLALVSIGENPREPRLSFRAHFTLKGIELWSSNISKNGAQLCCPMMRYDGLVGIEDRRFQVAWFLPKTKTRLSAQAAIRYANVCEDEVLVGLEFLSFDGQTQTEWYKFVDDLFEARTTDLA
ncbi:MAG: PilZ domain-containing protein [Gammaproteobacteria bacterium]